MINRRDFLKTGAAAATLCMVPSLFAEPEEKIKQPIRNYHEDMRYRPLGNTGLMVSVISMGGDTIVEPILNYAIDHGVNLVHISTHYAFGQSIKKLGHVLKGKRDRVYIALKDNFGNIDDALKDLGVDDVDLIMFNRHSVDAAQNPGIMEQFEKIKESGKARFCGLTSHGDVKNATAAGIESGLYQAVMPSLNPENFNRMQPELASALKNGVGVIAMKTMQGLRDKDMHPAQVKHVLSNPGVSTIVRGFKSFDYFKAFVQAAKEKLTGFENSELQRYTIEKCAQQCLMCDTCKQSCPKDVEISTILRCINYYADQEQAYDKARWIYNDITPEHRGDPGCGMCRACESVCPQEISIVEMLDKAYE